MTILHICSSYFETSLYKHLILKVSKLGIVNYVYVPRWHKDAEDIDEHLYVVRKRYSKFSKLLYWGEQCNLLKDVENRINLKEIDAIHVHRILYGGYIAKRIKERYGIPYIVTIRNSDIYGFGRNISIYKRHCLNIMENASKVIFVSNSYKDIVLNMYKKSDKMPSLEKKTAVIPNGIDDFFIMNIMNKRMFEGPNVQKTNFIRLISLGDINKNKNILTTVEACDILIKNGYNIILRLAGKILDKRVFRKVSSKCYVNYLGVLTKEQVRKELLNADIFVMPSIHETFGLVYAEAMTQGIPIIYTRGQGFDGQYENGEIGYSVDCHNADEIATRIIDIMGNYQNISNRCLKYSYNYSWDNIANNYKSIYNTLKVF